MKKSLIGILCLLLCMTMVLAGCNSKSSAPAAPAASGAAAAEPEWKFERKIEMVCTFGPGSGTDTTLRAFLPMLEKELGVNVIINNVEGASGVKGAEYLNKQPADGYTFGMYTPSHLIAAVNGTASFDVMAETEPVVCLVQDSNMVLAGPKTPFNNLAELTEQAKANPGKFKIGVMSIAGIDAVSINELFDTLGIDVGLVAYGTGAEAHAAVIGGHCDMVLSSPFDANAYLESGDMKGIVLLAEKRASNMTDVECTVELGYECTIGPWRGIVAKKGTPEGAIKAFEAAAVKVCQSQEWIDWKETVGLNDRAGFYPRAEYNEMWLKYYDTIKALLG